MSNPEAFLQAFLLTLVDHGQSSISLTLLLDKIDDAFHKYEVEKDLDVNGKKLYYELNKVYARIDS